jgi:protocatechuate 3,4-dioxygenase beta subunit
MTRPILDSLASGGPLLVLADAAVKATILLCLAAAVAASLKRSAAAVRHRLWALTLCGMALLPPLSWSLPGWRLPILPAPATSNPTRFSGDEGGASPGGIPAVEAGASDGFAPTPANSGRGHTRGGLDPDLRRSAGVRSSAGAVPDGPGSDQAALFWWSLGFVATASPAVAGVIGGAWRRRQSRPVSDPGWLESLDVVSRQLGLRRRVDLRTCPEPLIPATWGILRPVVLLPEQAERWPEPARRLVLLHELAHVKRWDVAFQLIGRLVASAYWFHPLAWYALHRLRAECEHACDDHVVHLGARRTDYARQLVDLARSLRDAVPTTAVPMTRGQTLERRIMAILDEGRSHEPLSDRLAGSLLATTVILLTGLAAVHPGSSAAGQPPGTDPPPAATANTAQDGGRPPVGRPEKTSPQNYTHPISVAGRAVDPAGKPIPGARVYLASLRADYKRVAETTTDAEGRYAFRDVPLPIQGDDTVNGRDAGSFQVFGEAEGLGFAWRPQKWFYPRPKRANITYEPDHRDPPSRYEAGEKVELDLHFSPPRGLAGTIVDDRGNPLPDVRLEIRDCESLTVVDNVIPGWTLDALNERDSAPPSMKIRTTDARGRFEFTGLPADCLFRIDVRAKNFPRRWVYAATTKGPQPARDGSPVFTGDLALTLATPIEVPIRLITGDTGRPAPKVLVQAVEGLVNTMETTDDQGRVRLRIPPGTYRMQYLPAHGTPYLVTDDELVVGANPPAEPIVAKLRPAAIVEVEVVDADTGEGLPNVDLWRQTGPDGGRELLYFRSWELATRIARVDRPRTDARGLLRALVGPGTHRLGVGWESYPRGYQAVEAEGQEIKSVAGETVRLKFAMRRRQ